jgi:CBS domain-containing protein
VLVGVVTDRDLCMASYTQGKPVAEIPVTAVMARGLKAVGIGVEELPDGARITGGRVRGGAVDSRGDHPMMPAWLVVRHGRLTELNQVPPGHPPGQ